jgi:hypothetical protein
VWVDGIFRILARDCLICCSAVEKFDSKIWFCPRSEVAAVTYIPNELALKEKEGPDGLRSWRCLCSQDQMESSHDGS